LTVCFGFDSDRNGSVMNSTW